MNLYDDIYDSSPNLYDDMDGFDESYEPNLYDGVYDESYEPNLYDDIIDEANQQVKDRANSVVNFNAFAKHEMRNTGSKGTYADGYFAHNALNKKKRDEWNSPLHSKDKGRVAWGSRIVSGHNEATEGISLSTKKLLSAGGHNSSDLNAVKPNAEYCDQYDKHFIGDGEDPETSRYNVPAILAAKTAGGAPFDQTLSNGINRASADVFHLKKLRDDEGMNG